MAASPTAAQAQPASVDVKLAEALAQQAFDAHARGDFTAALALYKRAYQASPSGRILFNIANIYDKKLGDKDQALDYYQQYLRSGDTESDLVKRATERVAIIRAELAIVPLPRADAVPAPPSAAPSGTAPPLTPLRVAASPSAPRRPVAAHGARLRWVGLATAAVGLGGLGLGGAYGLIAKSKNDQAAAMCDGSVCPDPRGVMLTDAARRAARVSTVSCIAGGVLAAGGIGLFLAGTW